MASSTFAEILKSSLDVRAIDRYFMEDRTGKTLEVLQKLRPEGRVDGGRFKLASVEGGAGSSTDYNLENHKWGDWSNSNAARGAGVVSFVQTCMKCSAAQAVKFLLDEKLLVAKEAKRSLADSDGDPLVLPIPEDKSSWEYVLDQDVMRKDRALIQGHWTYYDIDGQLLGYKYRVDQRNLTKEIYTLTFRAQSQWAKKAWQKKLVPLYGLQKLRGSPTVRVLLVEGEKAADAAQELLGQRWKVLAFSGVTASHDMWIPDEKVWEDCEVVLWPDNDTAGKDAMRRAQLALQKLRNKPREIRVVRVDAIPGLPPKWDLADWTPDCGVDVGVELERAEEADSFEAVCRNWAYVAQPDQFHNLLDRELILSPSAFDRRYAIYRDKAKPSEKFLSDRDTTKCEGLEFVPGEQEILVSDKSMAFLNEWTPTRTYQKARAIADDPAITTEFIAEKARNFIQHVVRIASGAIAEPDLDHNSGQPVPGTEGRAVHDALYRYLSEIVRNPMHKQGWVPMLVSEKNGTGKSYFLSLMEAIHGGNRCTVIKVEQYTSQYQDWRDGTIFYELAEVPPTESTVAYDEIKKNHNYKPFKFSNSGDRSAGAVQLNIKSRGMKTQRDFLNGFVTSNHLFPLYFRSNGDSGGDRRLLVVRCEQVLTSREATELYEEAQERAEWIAAWLMRYKPQHSWNPGWAPVTDHKRLMFEKDRERNENRADRTELGKYDEFFHFMQHAVREGVGGFARKVVTSETVRDICEHRRIKFPYEEHRFNKILEKAGVHRGPDVRMDGSVKRCYTTDKEWLAKPDKEWREELSKSLNGGI